MAKVIFFAGLGGHLPVPLNRQLDNQLATPCCRAYHIEVAVWYD
jgi:hypothetical protein